MAMAVICFSLTLSVGAPLYGLRAGWMGRDSIIWLTNHKWCPYGDLSARKPLHIWLSMGTSIDVLRRLCERRTPSTEFLCAGFRQKIVEQRK